MMILVTAALAAALQTAPAAPANAGAHAEHMSMGQSEHMDMGKGEHMSMGHNGKHMQMKCCDCCKDMARHHAAHKGHSGR